MSNGRILCPLLALAVAVAALPAFASNHNSSKTILLVSDYNAPVSLGGPAGGRHDDDELVYFLGAGDPAFIGTANEGKVDFGNGVPGSPNETLLIDSLGYTVNVDGMGGAWAAAENPFGIPIAGPSFPRKLPDNSAFDLVIFPLHRSGNYRDDKYRDVSVAGGGNGTTDIFGRTVADSWNGLEKPILTFNGAFAAGSGVRHRQLDNPNADDGISWRFGWLESNGRDVGDETSTRMQIQPDQLSNPFFAGLTTTADPDVPGGVEVDLFDWTYDPSLGYTNGTAPPGVQAGSLYYSRAPSIVARDAINPSIGEVTLGPVPGAKIVSGFGGLSQDFDTAGNFDVGVNPIRDKDVDGADFLMWQRGESWNGDTQEGMAEDLAEWELHFGNRLEGGGFIVDIPKGTDFNVPDNMGNPTNVPMNGPGLPDDVPFGIAGARRVLLPTWGYSLPVLDATGLHMWGEFQTANYFKLVENVVAEMILNPDGAVPAVAAAATVPEPTSLALAGLGLAAMSLVGRRRRR